MPVQHTLVERIHIMAEYMTIAPGEIGDNEYDEITVAVMNNHIYGIVDGVVLSDIDFAYGNMGCWKGDDDEGVINIFQEDNPFDDDAPSAVLASFGGSSISIIVDGWKEAQAVYKDINDLVEYDPYYWD